MRTKGLIDTISESLQKAVAGKKRQATTVNIQFTMYFYRMARAGKKNGATDRKFLDKKKLFKNFF